MTKTNIIPIEAIQERDTDLLLLEELHCSPTFRRWFIVKTIGKSSALSKFVGAWHSIDHCGMGESDIIVKFADTKKKRYLFLVENKIDAVFQPKQRYRYELRGERYIKDGECSDYATILFAPKNYIADGYGFDYTIEYEDMRDWFVGQGDQRSKYKAQVLSDAIEKSRRGYRPVRDDKTTKFWRSYWLLVNKIAPELGMREPRNDIPFGSGFIYFKPKGLRPGLRLIHKAERGSVDLEFSGMGAQIQQIKKKYKPALKRDWTVKKTNKSAVIRASVAMIDMQSSFDKQRKNILFAIQQLKELLNVVK